MDVRLDLDELDLVREVVQRAHDALEHEIARSDTRTFRDALAAVFRDDAQQSEQAAFLDRILPSHRARIGQSIDADRRAGKFHGVFPLAKGGSRVYLVNGIRGRTKERAAMHRMRWRSARQLRRARATPAAFVPESSIRSAVRAWLALCALAEG